MKGYTFILLFLLSTLQAAAQQWSADIGKPLYITKSFGDSVVIGFVDRSSSVDPLILDLGNFNYRADGIRLRLFAPEHKDSLYKLMDIGEPLDHILINFNLELHDYLSRPSAKKSISFENSIILSIHGWAKLGDTLKLDTLMMSNVLTRRLSLQECSIKYYFFTGKWDSALISSGAFNELTHLATYLSSKRIGLRVESVRAFEKMHIGLTQKTSLSIHSCHVDKRLQIQAEPDPFDSHLANYEIEVRIRESDLKSLELACYYDEKYIFENVEIIDTLDLYYPQRVRNQVVVPDGNFQAIHFRSGSRIIYDPVFDLRGWNLTLGNINRAELILRQSEIEEPDKHRLRASEEYSKWMDYVTEYNSNDTEMKSDSKAWLTYQKRETERNYYRNEGLYGFFTFVWLTIVKWIVNHGYHGEFQFFLIVTFFTLGWATLYYTKYKHDVRNFLTKESSPKPIPVNAGRVGKFATFFACTWFSFVVLINPRFPTSFFQFKPQMIAWIIGEWVLGLFMVILFVVFIASQYPFVKVLFGF